MVSSTFTAINCCIAALNVSIRNDAFAPTVKTIEPQQITSFTKGYVSDKTPREKFS
jgi:hypothetical protein